ncbi:hypothetical protein ASC97_29165 [Rhizobium sp. Root1203]|nr:hypothetical protein ASC97_29165 [Rhizobium sp. Root1203]
MALKRIVFSFTVAALPICVAAAFFPLELQKPQSQVATHPHGVRRILKQEGFAIGGKRAVDLVNTGADVVPGSTITAGLPLDLFHRIWRTRLSIELTGSNEFGLLPVIPNVQYAYDVKLVGRGLVVLLVAESSKTGDFLRFRALTSFEVTPDRSRDFGMRFLPSDDAYAVQPVIWLTGRADLTISSATVTRVRL